MDDEMIPVITRLACGLIINRPTQPQYSSQSPPCPLHVKLWDYLDVEGRIAFLFTLRGGQQIDFNRTQGVGWDGEVLAQTSPNTRCGLTRTRYSVLINDAIYQSGFIIQLIPKVLRLLCTTLSSLKAYRTTRTLAACHSQAPGNVDFLKLARVGFLMVWSS